LANVPGLAAATATVQISFEDLHPQDTVTDQYGGSGVVFSGPRVIDTSHSKWAARSGVRAVELAPIGEFGCQPTLELTFAKPTGRVGLWYGLQLQLVSDGAVSLSLIGSDGSIVGFAEQARKSGEGPEPVDAFLEATGKAPASRAFLTTSGGFSSCALVIDDVEFDPYVPPADLSIENVQVTFANDSMTAVVSIHNIGGTASADTLLAAQAAGWSSKTASVPAVEPDMTSDVTVVMNDAGAVPGTSFVLDIVVDGAKAGDPNTSNDETRITLEAPAPTIALSPSVAGSEAVPSQLASGGTPSSVGDNGSEWLPLAVGGALVGVVLVGSFLRPKAKPPDVSITGAQDGLSMTVHADGRTVTTTFNGHDLKLTAEDADPPKSCAPGAWYCRRSVTFDPGRRHVSSVAVGHTRRPAGKALTLDPATTGQLAVKLRRAARLDLPAASSAFAAIALELGGVIASVLPRAGAPTELTVDASIEGASARGTFTVYRCEGPSAADSAFKELGKRALNLQDHFESRLAHIRAFDASARARAELEVALTSGLEALARRL
jgi:hypothetical protein